MKYENSRKYQILLVDDDEEDFILTKMLLDESSFPLPGGGEVRFELHWKSSYDEALEDLEHGLYDACLVDLHLRGRDGLELLDFANQQKIRIPIIILTGKESYETDLKAARAGASDYLVKGNINAQLLERSIRYAIERKQSEDKLRKANEETTRLAGQLRQANRQLAYANHRLYAVLQALPVGVFIADSEGRIVTKNEMADTVWGGAPQVRKLEGYGEFKGWWADTGDTLLAEDWAIVRALKKGEVSIGEVIDILRFDKTPATILNSSAPIFDEDGNILGGVAVCQDITKQRDLERKAVEAAREAQRQAEELNAVLSSLNESVIVFNQKGLPIYANPAAVKILNLASYTFSQPGRSFSLYEPDGEENLPPESLPWNRALNGEKVTDEHYLLKTLAGQIYSVLVSASPIEMDRETMGAALVWRDLTEREQLMAQVADERSRLSKVIATAPIAFLVTDDKGVISFANPAAESLFDDQLLWKDLNIFDDVRFRLPNNGSLEITKFPLFLSLKKGETHISFELELARHDGTVMFLLMNSSPIINNRGQVSGAVAIFQDITQHKRNEEESRQKALRIEVQHHLIQYQEKERLTIARDLHDGPLQDLIGIQYQVSRVINQLRSKQRAEEDNLLPELIDSLDKIQLSLMGQIQEVRSFSSALRPPTLTAFGLEKAIRAHAEKFIQKHPEIFIFLDLEPDGKRLGDKTRLAFYRIYQELLSNIVRHSRASEVMVSLKLNSDLASLKVSDNGCGFEIPEDWIEIVRDGHLGLVGIRERAEAIGGRVDMKSNPETGTIITITAPIK
jgi:signal transduction histidine kinase/DNA-binding response OmpR family regulator